LVPRAAGLNELRSQIGIECSITGPIVAGWST
jgi:hypothetical protein